MTPRAKLAVGTTLGLAAFLLARRAEAASGAGEGGESFAFDWPDFELDMLPSWPSAQDDPFAEITELVREPAATIPVSYDMSTTRKWTADKIPAQYAEAIRAAEDRNGIPRHLLARLLWQESRYRANAVGPRTRYGTAKGIAQFIDATASEFGIDPFDAFASIDAAGRYLRQLYKATGSWRDALAAYNWGIGNLLKYGIARAPTETRNYYSQILADIGGLTYA